MSTLVFMWRKNPWYVLAFAAGSISVALQWYVVVRLIWFP